MRMSEISHWVTVMHIHMTYIGRIDSSSFDIALAQRLVRLKLNLNSQCNGPLATKRSSLSLECNKLGNVASSYEVSRESSKIFTRDASGAEVDGCKR
jgi:hypothetical protein